MPDGTIQNTGGMFNVPDRAAGAPVQREAQPETQGDSFVASTPDAKAADRIARDAANIQAAKELLTKSLKSLEDAKPDIKDTVDTGKVTQDGLEKMEPHFKAINLDTLVEGCKKDVSGEGKAVRAAGNEAAEGVTKAEGSLNQAKADLAPIEKNIDDAMALLKKVKDRQKMSIQGALWELENGKTWMSDTNRDLRMSGKAFGNGKESLKEMVPILDIVERDTTETDVGRFSKDLKELKTGARDGIMDGWLSARGSEGTLDGVKGYLTRALNYLK
ncbi:MAG: hypothetical protein RDV48_27625 [Candidatus Eremiobacteraeota bacterium]|nr:hypothetical protein [Candidatus Eremiobacteraeota bacterium]